MSCVPISYILILRSLEQWKSDRLKYTQNSHKTYQKPIEFCVLDGRYCPMMHCTNKMKELFTAGENQKQIVYGGRTFLGTPQKEQQLIGCRIQT